MGCVGLEMVRTNERVSGEPPTLVGFQDMVRDAMWVMGIKHYTPSRLPGGPSVREIVMDMLTTCYNDPAASAAYQPVSKASVRFFHEISQKSHCFFTEISTSAW